MIIDALTHVLPRQFNDLREDAIRRDATFRELFSNPKARIVQTQALLQEMDRSGVQLSVIGGFGWTDYELARISNDYLLDSAIDNSKRLIPLCIVNPLWGETALIEAERCLAAGARGIGELHADTQGWRDTELENLKDILALAHKHDAIVVVHGSEWIGHAYPGKGTMTPDRLLKLATHYPDNRFIFSHFGGGIPFYAQMPEVGAALKNVWFDSAASPFLYTPSVYASTTAAVGHDRVLFASDFPLLTQRRALTHMEHAELDAQTLTRVSNKNAASLYRIDTEV